NNNLKLLFARPRYKYIFKLGRNTLEIERRANEISPEYQSNLLGPDVDGDRGADALTKFGVPHSDRGICCTLLACSADRLGCVENRQLLASKNRSRRSAAVPRRGVSFTHFCVLRRNRRYDRGEYEL